MAITLRDYTDADLHALAALAADTFCETFGYLYTHADLQSHLMAKCSAEYFAKAVAEPHARIVLAWDNDEAVGYVHWGVLALPVQDAPDANAREIYRLYVRASHQSAGVGKRLFEHALAACADAPEVYLGVWEHNEKAQRFYARYGFTHAGEHTYLVGTHADRDLIWCRQR